MFFDVLLHLGTLVAVFVAYWADIRDMIREFFRRHPGPGPSTPPPIRCLRPGG